MNYSKRLLEIVIGFIVLVFITIFFIYFLLNVFKKTVSSYTVVTKFNEIGGLSTGVQVLIHGVIVGSVSKVIINKEDYNVMVYLSINSDIAIPIDSKVIIKDTNFFSDRKVEIIPGTSKQYIKDKEVLENTKDYMYLEDKISSLLFNNN